MPEPIDFYFDFSSPYGYLASEKIDELAARHGRKVRWRPILLGVVFKHTGAAPLTLVPLKGEYSLRDFARSARFLGVSYTHPARFPLATQHAARAYYWLRDQDGEQAWERARAFAQAVFRALYVSGRDVAALEVVLELAAQQGADHAALSEALAGVALKQRLKGECEAALAAGVCGSPYMIVDGEPFFGVDRLPQMERWLTSGGF
ncbi:MAG: 2-hydroxychromene-2-carboxylate isomerase [Candidatus Accumulibacter appositus]|uniref:2-hydroxychromene-2-carboxylate isomerase n=1 Tax=Candidatus Accumulibacter appositus TaxID=1454003 RepID=A0A011NZB5_9PROT|nr:2-hydroxychromene-2-carboxylate isomerase [Accumulibacter sp.]EXI80711.1 MAG: 2-hydroxychromene-2-carboxylate isomerase [Candidatus Accumulibacter appositus]HRF06534.1 2-hydroxychromene-2-carboxylate isomerase [Accumulibacter sp.]